MPEADTFEAPQGSAFHAEPLLQSVTEAFVGNGVLANGDGEVTPDANTAMGIQVAAASSGIRYAGTEYTPSSASFTLSNGPSTTTNGQDDRRVDVVYFDADTGSYGVTEGTADPNPVPPALPTNALVLAIVTVAHEATDIGSDDILNWRSRPVVNTDTQANLDTGFYVGEANTETITESTSPTGFGFSASTLRDVVDVVNVDLSNSTGGSVTENVTVTVYDGTDSTGTVVGDETKSVTLADTASTTESFLSGVVTLDDGDYYVEVTTTDLTVDETRVAVEGGRYRIEDDVEGAFVVRNTYTGTVVLRHEATDDGLFTDKNTTTVTSAFTTPGDGSIDVVFADTSSASFTVTLATADAAPGREVEVVDVAGNAGTNNVTVDTEGSGTIEGATSTSIASNYGSVTLLSDGTNWIITASS